VNSSEHNTKNKWQILMLKRIIHEKNLES
jgi:hypothetical protein